MAPSEKPAPPRLRRLIPAAMTARQRAYAPYSAFAVGAAVLGDDGRVYAGCNVENSSFGNTLCAERNAVGQAIARGARRIRAVAVVTPSRRPAPPCGLCLQTFAELGDPQMPVLLASTRGEEELLRLADLLPRGFGPGYLSTRSR